MKGRGARVLAALMMSVALLTVGSALSGPILRYDRHQTSIYKNVDGETMSFEKLMELIDTKSIVTIEDLVRELPSYMKNDRYVVMYRSRSLQFASPEAPRIITFSPSADFVLTFNGGDGVRGGNTVEIVQFREKTKRFEFRELLFDGVNRPTKSAANPRKCLECHQSHNRTNVDLRPNWEPYFMWPGAIGSIDSDLPDASLLPDIFSFKFGPQDQVFLREQKQEVAFVQEFERIGVKHPRYSHLGALNTKAPVELTERLGSLNFKRVVRLASEDKEILDAYRELLANLADCPLPGEMLRLQNANESLIKKYFYREPPESKILSWKLTRIFETLGVDTSDWSMDFGTRGRLAFRDRFGVPSDSAILFMNAWLEAFPGDQSLSRSGCDEISATVIPKVRALFESPRIRERAAKEKAKPAPAAQEILSRCTRCHSGQEPMAPKFDFADPLRLGSFLRKSRGPRTWLEEIELRTGEMATNEDQMPPNRRLSPDEHRVLMEYLRSL